MKLSQSLLLVALMCQMCRFSFANTGTSKGTLQFGLINGGSAFFDPIKQGFNQRCKELGVTCFDVVAFEPTDCTNRTDIMRDWIAMGVNGIAIKPCLDHDVMPVLFEEARQAGVPTVTFDDDVPDSARTAYVGTDNKFLGHTMAKLLRQLRSEGGTFALVGSKAERDQGFLKRLGSTTREMIGHIGFKSLGTFHGHMRLTGYTRWRRTLN